MDLAPLRAQLVADLSAATSVRVVDNPKHATPPSVLVGPIVSVERDGACVWEVQVPVWLIAPAPGDAKAVDFLAQHITDVLDACGDATASLGTYDVGQGPLPAYEVQVTLVGKE